MLKLQPAMSKYHEGVTFKRGSLRHKACIGQIEATAKTEREAQGALAEAVKAAIENMGNPLLLFDLVRPGEIWLAYQNSSGSWWYTHIRRAPGMALSGAAWEGGNTGAWDTRNECIEHMRAHWYQVNIEPIVMGVVALCTGLRQWVCKKCGYVQQGYAPYVCNAPRCDAQWEPKHEACAGCGEPWPCSDSKRTNIAGIERAKHHL